MLKSSKKLFSLKNRISCVLVSLMLPTGAHAQSCVEGELKLSSPDIASISNNFVLGALGSGVGLANEVVALAVSDITTLDIILRAAAGVSDSQKSAIGAGLARAAQACVATQPDFATRIQELVVGSGDSVILASFETAAGDIATAALGTTTDLIITPSDDGTSSGGSVGGDSNAGGSTSTGNGASSASISSSFSAPSFSGGSGSTVSPST